MAVHVIVWSEELWPISNPYRNKTLEWANGTPILPALGPTEEFRDPLDFCWTTTMKRNEVNYAAIIVILAAIAICVVSFWITFQNMYLDANWRTGNYLVSPRTTEGDLAIGAQGRKAQRPGPPEDQCRSRR